MGPHRVFYLYGLFFAFLKGQLVDDTFLLAWWEKTRVHENQINKYGPRQQWAQLKRSSLFTFSYFFLSSQLLECHDSRIYHSLLYSPSFLVCTGSSLAAAGKGLYVPRSSLSFPIFSAASSSATGVPRDWVSVSSR